jgi:hypothetical protein
LLPEPAERILLELPNGAVRRGLEIKRLPSYVRKQSEQVPFELRADGARQGTVSRAVRENAPPGMCHEWEKKVFEGQRVGGIDKTTGFSINGLFSGDWFKYAD